MVADPGRFKPTNGKSSGFLRRKVGNHSAPLPHTDERGSAPRTAGTEFPSVAADRTPLLEYIAFVLDQEAKYCQQ
jgi:hypothetical protein